MLSRLRALAPHLLLIAVYLGVGVAVTYPLILNLSTSFVGFVFSDAYETAHHIWWFRYALTHGEPLFTHTLLGYPHGIPAVQLWANPLQYFPAWALALLLPLPIASNLAILLTLALNGWAMALLASKLTRAPVLSAHGFIAGIVFMLYPTLQGHLAASHTGLIVQWPAALYGAALFGLRAQGGSARLLTSTLLFILAALGHTLQVITVLLPLTALFALLLIWRREWAALRRVIVVALVGAAGVALFIAPVAASALNPAFADEGGAVRYSADLLAVVSPSFRNPLFAALEYPRRVLGVNLEEGAAYFGIVTFALALIAVWRRPAARWWALTGAAAYLLSLGPLLKVLDQPVLLTLDGYISHITMPWALAANLPLFELARAPARFNFLLALAAGALAAHGAQTLLSRLSARNLRAGVAVLIAGCIAFEYQILWPVPLADAAVPDAIAGLRMTETRAVLNLPWDNLLAAKEALYLQTAHERPLIAGHDTRRTPVNPAFLSVLERTLNPALLQAAGAEAVIIHRQYEDGTLSALARERLGAPIYEDNRFGLYLTPREEMESAAIEAVLPLIAVEIREQADHALYVPAMGWALLTGTWSVPEDGAPREIVISRDRIIITRALVSDAAPFNIPIPVEAGGFHTLTLALDPPCPRIDHPALACRAVEVRDAALEFIPAENAASATFEHGVTLGRASLSAPTVDDRLAIYLWWQFAQPRTESDVRFVHVFDTGGMLVAQQDRTLGNRRAGEAAAEVVTLSLGHLPPGEYSVHAGWYSHPDITPFCALQDGACVGSSALIGMVRVR